MTWKTLGVPQKPSGERRFAVSFEPPPDNADFTYARLQVANRQAIVVERTWDNVAALRAAGHDVPHVVEDYNWPARPGVAPMAHQRQSVEFMVDHERCANLSDPGTGKTLAALWAADLLMRHRKVRRVLIVAPLSILRPVWAKEIYEALPHRTFAPLLGGREAKRKLAGNRAIEFLVVNYESLHMLEGYLPDVDLVIADESTKIKNYRARRTQALVRIADGKRLWLLTGTPAPQAPTDAYTSIRALRNGDFMAFKMFQAETMYQTSAWTWAPKRDAAETVARYLAPSIRFRRQDCFDLPDRQFIDLAIEPTDEQVKLSKDFLKQAWAELKGQKITAVNAGVALSKALQVLSGGVYHPQGEDSAQGATIIDASPLMDEVCSIVEQTEGPVLVFAPFRLSAAIIHERLLRAGLKSVLVQGGMNDAQRTAAFEAVQAGAVNAMVAIPQTVSHGLTLTTSDTIIWIAPPFSFETYEQGNARIYRKGQTRKTQVYRVMQGTFMNALWRRLDDKASLQDTLLRLMEGKE